MDADAAAFAPPTVPGLTFGERLGEGGMATVWRARQDSLGREVAVKVLHDDRARSAEEVDRFRSEARSVARLHHPAIVQVFDAFHADGRFCFVMELVDGETLSALMRRVGPLPEDVALGFATSIADALLYAWDTRRLVHLDVKPDNILIDRVGRTKLADFGLARSLHSVAADSPTDSEGFVFGTPAYMSPELAQALPGIGPQTDMYALGATLYHIATGHKLFDGRPEEEVPAAQVSETDLSPKVRNPSLSRSFCHLLEMLLAKGADDRFASWEDARAALGAVRDGIDFPATGVASTIQSFPS